MLRLCHYRQHYYDFDFKLTSDAKIQPFFLKYMQGDLFLPWSRAGHDPRPIFMLWLVKIWQVRPCVKFMQHILKVVYFDSWSWHSFESTCDVFNCLFPLNVQNEIQLLSRVFSYSLLVCLLGFCWEMRRLSKPIIRFRTASFLFFTLLDACENYKGSSDPCLSKIAKLLYLYLTSWSRAQFMKLVYARLYQDLTETLIWHSMRFDDISL